jgi:hypothetical protein
MEIKRGNLEEAKKKAAKAFGELCKKYGVAGEHVKHELKQLTRELPVIFVRTQELIAGADMTTLIDCYRKVTKDSHGADIDLPALTSLRAAGLPSVDIDHLQDKYAVA